MSHVPNNDDLWSWKTAAHRPSQGQVEQVAEALSERGRISGAEVGALIGWPF
jgi:hypothetical protein